MYGLTDPYSVNRTTVKSPNKLSCLSRFCHSNIISSERGVVLHCSWQTGIHKVALGHEERQKLISTRAQGDVAPPGAVTPRPGPRRRRRPRQAHSPHEPGLTRVAGGPPPLRLSAGGEGVGATDALPDASPLPGPGRVGYPVPVAPGSRSHTDRDPDTF